MEKTLLMLFCFVTILNAAEPINKKENPLLADLFNAKYTNLTIYYDNMPFEENVALKALEDLRKNQTSNIVDYLVINENVRKIYREKVCVLQPLEAVKSITQAHLNDVDFQPGLILYCTALNDEAHLSECIGKIKFMANTEWKVFIKTHSVEFAQLLCQHFPDASKCINLRWKSEGSFSQLYSSFLGFFGLER